MSNQPDVLQGAKVTLVRRPVRDWLVERSGSGPLGPYFNVAVALQASVIEVVAERKRGARVDLFVRNDGGDERLCDLIDHAESHDVCRSCEGKWKRTNILAPSACPVRNAFRGG